MLPIAVVLGLLPGPAVVHLLLPALLILSSGFTAVAYADDLRDRRLRQHGFRPERER